MSEITGPNEALPPPIALSEPAWIPPTLEPLPPEAPLPRPIPFEDLEAFPGFWARVGGMFRMIFSNPMELFDRVPTTDGLGAPWRFLLLLSAPVFLIMALIFFFGGMAVMLAALEHSGQGSGKGVAAAVPLIFGVMLLLMPLFSFLGMVIGGAISHFFLWLWGGTRNGVGIEQSIRAYGYGSAFTQLAGFVPYLGPLIQLAGWVVIMLGLARMHRTETWRAICALISQIVLSCCCLGIVIWAFVWFIVRNH